MSKHIDALKLALEALENNKQTHYYCEDIWYSCPQHEEGCANDSAGDECNCGADKENAEIDKAITAIKEALAQPEQRPISDVTEAVTKTVIQVEKLLCEKLGKQWQPSGMSISTLVDELALRTTPPQRTWVGLTDEEIVDAYDVARVSFKRSQQGIRGQMLTSRDSPDWHYAKAIEAKLKEKNNG